MAKINEFKEVKATKEQLKQIEYNKQKEESKKAQQVILDDFDELVATMCIVAQTHKAYFDSLINNGFTPDQAIYLVGKHGTSFGMPMEPR